MTFMSFIAARLPGPDGKPDPEKIKAFATANPETTRQAAWLNARPVPASFAGVDYWGVQAYTLTSALSRICDNLNREALVAVLEEQGAEFEGPWLAPLDYSEESHRGISGVAVS